jgi:hypothetical protein
MFSKTGSTGSLNTIPNGSFIAFVIKELMARFSSGVIRGSMALGHSLRYTASVVSANSDIAPGPLNFRQLYISILGK